MHPAGGAVDVGAAGGAAMDVRASARASFILGLAIAAIALLAATISPGDFHAQTIEQAAPAPAPGAQQRCAATEAEAVDLREVALDLVLTGVAQAVFAAAADVALAGSIRVLGPCLATLAHLYGAINAWYLCDFVNGAAVVAVGHCAGGYLTAGLVLGYVLIALSYASLLGVSLAVTWC